MHLSRASDYTIRILLVTTKDGKKKPVSTRKLANVLGVSPRYLLAVGSQLRDAGYVSVDVGPHGGYVLERDPSEINLLEIVELIEGPLVEPVCDTSKSCDAEIPCPLHDTYVAFQNCVRGFLQFITIADILGEQAITGQLQT